MRASIKDICSSFDYSCVYNFGDTGAHTGLSGWILYPKGKRANITHALQSEALTLQSEALKWHKGNSCGDALLAELNSLGLTCIDKRSKHGALWVIDDPVFKEKRLGIEAKYKVRFKYSKQGSRSTSSRPAWYTK